MIKVSIFDPEKRAATKQASRDEEGYWTSATWKDAYEALEARPFSFYKQRKTPANRGLVFGLGR